jgi:hypothetical protein
MCNKPHNFHDHNNDIKRTLKKSILYINSLRPSMTGPGIQADRAWRGGWGKERSVTDRPGPDFDRPGPTWGVGEGEVCYRQTRPGIPGF